MFENQVTGSVLAACASLFWTLAPFLFASAVRRIGAGRVNPLRLAGAALVLCTLSALLIIADPAALSTVNMGAWGWLALSGVAGLVIGDALYLTSLGYLGPRRTLQILVLAPAFSALIAWLWLGEALSLVAWAGLGITLLALSLATAFEQSRRKSTEPGIFSWTGFALAIAATGLHGGAAVLARKAFLISTDLNPILATSIRITSSAVVIWLWVFIRGQGPHVIQGLSNRPALSRLGAATLLGPILGMLCYVSAFKSAPAGVVSLLSSLSPILIIPITAWRYKTRINFVALWCMILAIAGVLLVVIR